MNYFLSKLAETGKANIASHPRGNEEMRSENVRAQHQLF